MNLYKFLVICFIDSKLQFSTDLVNSYLIFFLWLVQSYKPTYLPQGFYKDLFLIRVNRIEDLSFTLFLVTWHQVIWTIKMYVIAINQFHLSCCFHFQTTPIMTLSQPSWVQWKTKSAAMQYMTLNIHTTKCLGKSWFLFYGKQLLLCNLKFLCVVI